MTEARLLHRDEVRDYLVGRRVLTAGDRVDVQELGGGVSCQVFAVTGARRALVVKQALERFRVAADWQADPERANVEARALAAFGRLTPENVPELIDSDPARHALTMTQAPAHWRNWKSQLLVGSVDATVPVQLGAILARWHARTMAVADLPRVFAPADGFEQQRISPYHLAVRSRHPELGARIDEIVAELLRRRLCLVHGDFSPKNMLVGPDGLWVLDFEIAHVGDPSFDVAFLLTHLALKAVHVPAAGRQLTQAAGDFLAAYERQAPRPLLAEPAWLAAQVGCLLLARVDGKSPAEYLTVAEQSTVRALGTGVLTGRLGTVTEVLAQAAG